LLIAGKEGGVSGEGSTSAPDFEWIEIDKIEPNPQNPRGQFVRDYDPGFGYLKDSIAEVGILVPLVVRCVEGGKYRLIDGERRYEAARALNMKRLPAYIITQDLDDEQVRWRMFHIHMTRRPWDPVEQCKASNTLYAELWDKYRDERSPKLVDEYSRITGMDRRTAEDRVRFLRWPDDIKQRVYASMGEKSIVEPYTYMVEIEKQIMEPAQKNYPEYFREVKASEVRAYLLSKLEAGVIKAGEEAREAAVITRSSASGPDREKVIAILDRLVKTATYSFAEAREDYYEEFPQAEEARIRTPRALWKTASELWQALVT
jgi:ParB/RepB/Spo0J family partition protein